jgi:glutamyl/glutaminyl-tRNA synthetase
LQITHVIRGKDLLPATELHRALARALGAEPPEYLHHGLILGPDGAKLAKRHGAASVADLREQGIPAEAVRNYLEELDLPRSDVHLDPARIARLAVDAIQALPDEELTGRAGVPLRLAPALRGARTLVEARAWAQQIHDEPPPPELDERGRATLERFRELLERAAGELDEDGARALVRELKAVGGDLRTLRLALTGASSGPELWAVLVALAEGEALRRAGEALTGS